jgi:uncharacterized membrane protein YccF (DUF307 family)
MKIWIAICAAILVVVIRFIFAVFRISAVSYFPFLEMAVFLVGLLAFKNVSFTSRRINQYLLWSVIFLSLTLVLISLIDFASNTILSNIWMNYAILILDFVAGLSFVFVFRLLFRRNTHQE